MPPITRHDLALLFVRALAVFALYTPFLMMCTIIAELVMGVLIGSPMAPLGAGPAIPAFWHLLIPRLLAAFILWRFAPPIARLISSAPPTPEDAPAPSAPRAVVPGPAHR